MTEYPFTQRSFELLEELVKNNEKVWYLDHKKEFAKCLREPFAFALELASHRLENAGVPLSGGTKTMFRQHRDIRFSKDKSPYNTHVSGVLTQSGAKTQKDGLVYVHLNSMGGFIACGYYQLKPADLTPLRDRILNKPEEFSTVLKSLERVGLSLSREDNLKTMPRGYNEHENHEYADYLKLKSFIVQVQLDRSAWIENDIVDYIVECAQNCVALLKFGKAANAVG